MSTAARVILAGAGVLEIALGGLIVAKPEKLVNPKLKRRTPPEVRLRRWRRQGIFYLAAGVVQIAIVVVR